MLSLVTIWTLTFLIFGFLPYQFGFAARSSSVSLLRLVTMNGPLDTGLSKNLSPCAFTSFSGTTEYAYIARSASSGACGRDILITSVCASDAFTLVTLSSRNPQPPFKFFARRIEYAASWAVSGEPSLNFAERSLNV